MDLYEEVNLIDGMIDSVRNELLTQPQMSEELFNELDKLYEKKFSMIQEMRVTLNVQKGEKYEFTV